MSRKWFCANRECSNTLGSLTSGNELVLDLDNIISLNTDGTKIVAVCRKCGTAKIWYPSLESISSDLTNTIVFSIINGLSNKI